MSSCNSGLNKFLLILVFLGIIFILLNEREGFGNALDEAYNGALLRYFDTQDDPHKEFKNANTSIRKFTETEYSRKQVTNNPKYRKIPCNGEKYDGGICKALYKENTEEMIKNENCMPSFDCRRVGFFCSKLGK